MKKATIGVVVPAYNEEQVITDSLKSLKKVISPKHIYVVSDGSVDKTASLARQAVPNVLALGKNRGKAGALKELLDKYTLTEKYDYIFFFDADTRIDINFIRSIKKTIKESRPACVVGTVSSARNKLISAYRVYEYGFSHMFFKNAQNAIGAIVVAPGCASVYRADVLAQLDMGRKTLTEDLDFTLQIHRRKLGKIVYCPKAKVLTQDPQGFSDYWKQVTRWNTGFWQNFILHKLYLPTSKISAEVWLLTGDFIYWLIILALAINEPILFLTLYGTAMILTTVIATVTAAVLKQYWAIPYAPLFGFFHVVNVASFVYSFFRTIFSGKRNLSWQKVSRYALR
jgi:biofilm PGA synthesis N-glycosyltransferase PgaC